MSSVAWHGLITAVEHLDFGLTALAKTQTLYPAVYFTTLRVGLLGAAQAVWVLEPTMRRERQLRALTAAAANYNEQRKMIGALSPSSPEQQAELAVAKGRLADRLEEAAKAAESIGVDPVKARKLTLVATDVSPQESVSGLRGR
ncbi:hypothetical protein ACFYUY_31185 [Kitasatospora sp. NPDC004745]|uniref:hypothetical protein n=1 Tax=Kitasatospora sp. NPDC004745 TaxID=3364019 RepID=UPI0036D14744